MYVYIYVCIYIYIGGEWGKYGSSKFFHFIKMECYNARINRSNAMLVKPKPYVTQSSSGLMF